MYLLVTCSRLIDNDGSNTLEHDATDNHTLLHNTTKATWLPYACPLRNRSYWTWYATVPLP